MRRPESPQKIACICHLRPTASAACLVTLRATMDRLRRACSASTSLSSRLRATALHVDPRFVAGVDWHPAGGNSARKLLPSKAGVVQNI